MSRRLLAVLAGSLLFVSAFAGDAFAQERTENASKELASVRVLSINEATRGYEFDQRSFPVPPAPRPSKSALLGSLYATTALMHALDVHSTILALDRGAIEANPLMAGVTKNRAAFIATKAAVATSSILAARSLAKRNKVAAIVSMVAINSVYGMVVQHNYKVARQLK